MVIENKEIIFYLFKLWITFVKCIVQYEKKLAIYSILFSYKGYLT